MSESLPAKGRVVLTCNECGAPVSWPVSADNRRRAVTSEPEPGRFRRVTDVQGRTVLVTALASARLGPIGGTKRARYCTSGHYVADMNSAPHPPPWVVEFHPDRVSWRRVED